MIIWFVGIKTTYIDVASGDLSYRVLGVQVGIERMPLSYREPIRAAAERQGMRSPEWHRVMKGAPTNNSVSMCRGFYARIVPWLGYDTAIGDFMLVDTASYIRKTNARYGAPDSLYPLLWGTEWANGDTRLREGWSENETMLEELDRLGFAVKAEP